MSRAALPIVVSCLLVACCPLYLFAEVASARLEQGKQLYEESCADCHGERGQGVADGHEQPLVGDVSLAELAQVIAETMPEGDEDACVGEDAESVAAYIYEAFYGPNAQKKKNSAKIRLARLTARQLRQSLADLYQRFDDSLWHTDDQGIKARYFNRDSDDGKVQFDRVDPTIDFDFGHDGPGQGINKENFSIRWTGSLKPEETGRYEFIVRSENSFILYFGDYKRKLVDNYTQSAERTTFRESVYLTAGSIYPLSIEFNQRKRKTEQPPAKISLSWKTPRGVEQIIPMRALINMVSQPTFYLQTKLPPDDRSYGYERGIAVDEQWNTSTTAAAIEFAQQVSEEAWPKYRKKQSKEANENRQRLRTFLTGFVETAFRGPLPDELQTRYIEQQLAKTESDQEAIKRVLLLTVKSPRFLYPLIDSNQIRSYRAANRLALTLFDSLPVDQWLRDAAENNQLDTAAQVREATWKMMGDWRVRAKMRSMLHHWLNLERFANLSKSVELNPDFDATLVAELRASLDGFLDEIVWSDKSDFRQLYLANWSFTTPHLAAFYGEGFQLQNPDESFGRTKPRDDTVRFGVLTHPLMMSGLAYDDVASPIHRGVFLLRYTLGRILRPPNEAFTPLNPDLHPALTTRERVSLQTAEKNCQVCHAKINGLGFTLENFDAVGRYQTQQRARAIDSSGSYITTNGESVTFAGPKELAEFLAHDEDAQRAFIKRAFQFFAKQPPLAYGGDLEDRLFESFRANDFSIYELIVDIAVAVSHQSVEMNAE